MSSPRSSEYSISELSSVTSGSSATSEPEECTFVEDGFDASRVMYRPMNSGDVQRVKEMHHDFLKSSATVAHIRHQLSHSHRRVFVAFIPSKGSVVIGFASALITFHGVALPPDISINAVGVDPLYRSHGVGENLIRAVSASLLMSSTSHGKGPADGNAVVLVELKSRDKAIGYFEKLGWEREGEVRKGISWGAWFLWHFNKVGYVGWAHSMSVAGRVVPGRVSVQDSTVRLTRWINAHEL
ncbi:GNAT family acetyltransferase [Ceratobasidium sp. AG-Ba]|nr:GNAT family acetyltransferase [Ceratobasidium sp. AG-Ba]